MNKILVYGATGDQGLPLIDELLKNGYKVRAASRNPDDFKFYNTSDVESVKADLFDIDSLKTVSKDIDGITMNLPFVFDKKIAQQWGENITKAGAEAGIKKIIFNTSCYVAPTDNGLAAHDGRRAIEKAMEESGMDYVVIRSMVFMDNLTRFWSKPSIINNNTFAYPCSSDLKISWVCLNDVAKFMVASLSNSSVKADKIYVGGPEILCGAEVAERFSRALNREIKFKSLDPRNFAGAMSKLVTGSEEYEDVSIYGGMAAFYKWYNDQDPSPLAIDMKPAYKLLNVIPTYFEEWIKEHDWSKV